MQGLPGATLDLSQLPSRYPMLLIAPQSATEAVLEARAVRLGVPIERGAEVTELEQDADGVRVSIATADGTRTEKARYVVALALIRPDAYVAWASDRRSGDGLADALRRWCGPAAVSRTVASASA